MGIMSENLKYIQHTETNIIQVSKIGIACHRTRTLVRSHGNDNLLSNVCKPGRGEHGRHKRRRLRSSQIFTCAGVLQ